MQQYMTLNMYSRFYMYKKLDKFSKEFENTFLVCKLFKASIIWKSFGSNYLKMNSLIYLI